MEFEEVTEEKYSDFLREIQEFGIDTAMSPPSTPTSFLDQPSLPLFPLHTDYTPTTDFGPPPHHFDFDFSSASSSTSTANAGAVTSPPLSSQATFLGSPQGSEYSESVPQVQAEEVSIVAQPESYQVVNYNVYPAPELEFSRVYEHPVTVQAVLVYDNSVEIGEAFTNGEIQVLKTRETRVTFPALHLNRMTPIKNSIQQHGLSMGSSFCIKWKIGEITLHSTPFKLVSACTQIPEGVEVRPRQKGKEKVPKEISKHFKTGEKRRRADEVQEDEIFLHVKIRGESEHRGFISVPKNATLATARTEITRSNHYPLSYRFWYERMKTVVQPHQEDTIRAEDAIDGTCLILDEYDSTMDNITDQILSLWLSKKEVKDPTVPLVDLIRTLFSVYKAETSDLNELNIINGGISHFLANITKSNSQPGMVSLEDFKLFLKFFGPPQECLVKVLNVYREPFFHGFARHSDAVDLLKGNPGAFLLRFSESQLKDGFFAFNVNKGNTYKDVIENYSIKYRSDLGHFIFRNKTYRTLRDITSDSEYKAILKRPLCKTTIETVKESKYRSDADFLASPSKSIQLNV